MERHGVRVKSWGLGEQPTEMSPTRKARQGRGGEGREERAPLPCRAGSAAEGGRGVASRSSRVAGQTSLAGDRPSPCCDFSHETVKSRNSFLLIRDLHVFLNQKPQGSGAHGSRHTQNGLLYSTLPMQSYPVLKVRILAPQSHRKKWSCTHTVGYTQSETESTGIGKEEEKP